MPVDARETVGARIVAGALVASRVPAIETGGQRHSGGEAERGGDANRSEQFTQANHHELQTSKTTRQCHTRALGRQHGRDRSGRTSGLLFERQAEHHRTPDRQRTARRTERDGDEIRANKPQWTILSGGDTLLSFITVVRPLTNIRTSWNMIHSIFFLNDFTLSLSDLLDPWVLCLTSCYFNVFVALSS